MRRVSILLLVFLWMNSGFAQYSSGRWTRVSFSRSAPSVPGMNTGYNDPLTESIPVFKKNLHRYALIIGNENYEAYQLGLQNVEYAVNDAKAFREFALHFWGVPEENVFYLENATAGLMHSSAERISLLLKTAPAGSEVLFYFSGHGIQTADGSSFIPAAIDNDPMNSSNEGNLNAIFEKIIRNCSIRVIAFTDACFSGRNRQGTGALAVRGIRHQAVKGSLPKGVILFAGAGENQYAFSWNEKKHGLFTAVLLENLLQANGRTTWGELVGKVKKVVMEKAARLHHAAQVPVLAASSSLLDQFQQEKIKR